MLKIVDEYEGQNIFNALNKTDKRITFDHNGIPMLQNIVPLNLKTITPKFSISVLTTLNYTQTPKIKGDLDQSHYESDSASFERKVQSISSLTHGVKLTQNGKVRHGPNFKLAN